MFRQSASVPAQAPEREFPELPPEWLTKPANDSVVVSAEPFNGVLRAAPATQQRVWGRPRIGRLITTAVTGSAVAVAAAVLTIGWFSLVTSQTSANLSTPLASKSPDFEIEPQASVQINGPMPDLTEGINALRARMQAAQGAIPSPTARIDVATPEMPQTIGRSTSADEAAMAPRLNSAAPGADAAASQPKMTADESRAMLDRAKEMIAIGDIAAARRLAEYVAASGDGGALFTLATTFDPKQLARWRVRGVRSDKERARNLYLQALQLGVAEAQSRLAALP